MSKPPKSKAAQTLGSLGGKATMGKLTPEERHAKAQAAAKARWAKVNKEKGEQ